MKKQTKTTKVALKPTTNSVPDSTLLVAVISMAVLIALVFFVLRKAFKTKAEPEFTKAINARGYVVLLPINELEHRYIAKQNVGRNLTADEHVHHINGNKTDNAIGNLCLMDEDKHEHFHSWLRWKLEKDGQYPTISEQKRALVEQYDGTLLETLTGGQHTKLCPGCNSPMVLRTAKKGKRNGRQFWGCTRYPKCRSSVAA